MHAPRPVRIVLKRRESSRHTTFGFHDKAIASYAPGQFVMVWIPGVDEVPMALWGDGDPYLITVEAKGDATTALCALKEGATIGIRGPYGKPFRPDGQELLLVAGGTGTVPLVEVARAATAAGSRVRVVVGGRSREFVLLQSAFEKAGAEVHVATDDGSQGHHGRAHELAARLIAQRKPDRVLTCGPERMMRAVAQVCWDHDVPFSASLERWMKCAVGICDACLVDGLRLCRDGPVLDGTTLRTIEDFGAYERLPDGRRVAIH